MSSSNNWLQLCNKTAIVTGAGSGIGAAIAKAFVTQGCNVLLVDVIDPTHVLEQCHDIVKTQMQTQKQKQTQIPSVAIGIQCCDVTIKNEVSQMMQYADLSSTWNKTKNDHIIVPPPSPPASILVNAAGITRDGLIHQISEADYDDVLDTNLKGTFLTCQAFCHPERLNNMLGLGYDSSTSSSLSSSIINIGSIVSEKGNVGQSNYGASKGGVIGLTRSLAKEMAFYSTRRSKMGLLYLNHDDDNDDDDDDDSNKPQRRDSNVRVNAIIPGFIDTPMSEAVPEHVKEGIRHKIPLKEFGTVDDIANMVLFLASPRSRYVTGTTLECSGMIAL